jgi:hypothetical protein
MKAHEESRIIALLTLTVALETFITLRTKHRSYDDAWRNDEDAISQFIPEKGNVHTICT